MVGILGLGCQSSVPYKDGLVTWGTSGFATAGPSSRAPEDGEHGEHGEHDEDGRETIDPSFASTARGAVPLRRAQPQDVWRGVARAYLRAMMTQDLEAVATLLAPEAMRTGGKAPGGRAALMAWLRQRMLGMSNTVALEGVSLPVDRLEIYAFDDLGGEGRRARPLEMAPGDVLLRMPVQWPRGRGERLMNEVILLLLRPQGARWLIAGIQEEG